MAFYLFYISRRKKKRKKKEEKTRKKIRKKGKRKEKKSEKHKSKQFVQYALSCFLNKMISPIYQCNTYMSPNHKKLTAFMEVKLSSKCAAILK